jgi:histone deacetylase 6
MRFHAEFPEFMALNDIHPEDPRRIAEIFKEIQQAGLVQGADDLDKDAHDEQCWRIVARPAIKGEICLIHTPEHYEFIKGLQGMSFS